MNINIIIKTDHVPIRLDSLICDELNRCSRKRAVQLIQSGLILVNGQKKKPGYRVKAFDEINGQIPAASVPTRIVPEVIELDIQYEDEHLLVVNKPPGMVVHPAPGNMSGTLVNALIAHDPAIEFVGDDPSRAGIVHRLDKETSGLIVVAKTNEALITLQNEFKQRNVNKRYLAIVSGNMPETEGKIELPIGRHPVKRKLMAVNHDTGKSALSFWKVKRRYESASYVEVTLKTGRTHQIRVHFYAIDHPLIGDPVYQPRRMRKAKSIAQRQMLHSWRLGFCHPISNETMRFEVAPPEDFNQVLLKLESL